MLTSGCWNQLCGLLEAAELREDQEGTRGETKRRVRTSGIDELQRLRRGKHWRDAVWKKHPLDSVQGGGMFREHSFPAS